MKSKAISRQRKTSPPGSNLSARADRWVMRQNQDFVADLHRVQNLWFLAFTDLPNRNRRMFSADRPVDGQITSRHGLEFGLSRWSPGLASISGTRIVPTAVDRRAIPSACGYRTCAVITDPNACRPSTRMACGSSATAPRYRRKEARSFRLCVAWTLRMCRRKPPG